MMMMNLNLIRLKKLEREERRTRSSISLKEGGSARSAKTTTLKAEKNASDARKEKMTATTTESQNICFCQLSKKPLSRPLKREKTKDKNWTSSWDNKLNWMENKHLSKSWPTWTKSTLSPLPIHLELPFKTSARSHSQDHSRLKKVWPRSKGRPVKELETGLAKDASTTTTHSERCATCAISATLKATRCCTISSRTGLTPSKEEVLNNPSTIKTHSTNSRSTSTKASPCTTSTLHSRTRSTTWCTSPSSSKWRTSRLQPSHHCPRVLNHSFLLSWSRIVSNP